MFFNEKTPIYHLTYVNTYWCKMKRQVSNQKESMQIWWRQISSFTFDIYLTIDPNAPADCSIFAFHNSNGTTNDLQLFRAGSDNKLFFYYRGRQSDAFSVPFGEPFHLTIIAVFGQAYTYIYVNGTKIIQMPGSFYGNTFSSIWLGKCKDDAKPLFKGSINQFRLYNRSAWELIN